MPALPDIVPARRRTTRTENPNRTAVAQGRGDGRANDGPRASPESPASGQTLVAQPFPRVGHRERRRYRWIPSRDRKKSIDSEAGPSMRPALKSLRFIVTVPSKPAR